MALLAEPCGEPIADSGNLHKRLHRFFTAIRKRPGKGNSAFIFIYNIVSFFIQMPNDNKK